MSGRISPVHKRIAIFLAIIIGAAVALTARVGWVQFVNGPRLAAQVQSQLKDSKILQSPRGTIYDRSGRELAISNLAKSLYANPKELSMDPAALAPLLGEIVGMKAEEIKERLTVDARFIWIKRTLEPQVAAKVEALIKEHKIRGLNFVEESKRYYPNDSLAAQVLGFVGVDDIGLEGIEMALDKIVKGQHVRQLVDTDSNGVPIFKSIFDFSPHKQGKSVVLTIDNTIQFIVEQSLDKAMEKTKARAATIIVMNPKTGEILAMASRPNYNPNRFYDYSPLEWKNRALSIIYEPGSTFKAIVAAAALQEGLVRPDEQFVDKGFIEVSGRRIKNWSGDSYGTITFTEVIKNSINTGFVEVGLRLGPAKLNEYARAFGFGRVTGIELPGEEEGLLFKTSQMRDSDLATMSIGQSIAVTPLQLLTAVSAIANDGILVKPYIVKEIYNPDGSLASATPTQPVRQVISPDTARILKGMLEKVVSEGGGKKAAVPGYMFAGKTGTAERLKEGSGGYEAGRYIASFVGFGPVADPAVAALVVLDDPQGVFYGGEIAAPVFSEIMVQIVRYLNIPPQGAIEMPLPKPQPKAEVKGSVPAGPLPEVPAGKVIVPDVKGKTIREAGEAINKLGLAFIPSGTGIAVRQSIAPNTAVDHGAEVIVYFEPH